LWGREYYNVIIKISNNFQVSVHSRPQIKIVDLKFFLFNYLDLQHKTFPSLSIYPFHCLPFYLCENVPTLYIKDKFFACGNIRLASLSPHTVCVHHNPAFSVFIVPCYLFIYIPIYLTRYMFIYIQINLSIYMSTSFSLLCLYS